MRNVADMIDPHDEFRRTYREINGEQKHNIKLYSLVETDTGARLFVRDYARDCDSTPLYCLSATRGGVVVERGYPEESLRVIKV